MTVRRLIAPTHAEITALAEVFDRYREHYGEQPDPARTAAWLEANLAGGRLDAFAAEADGEIAGFATVVAMPASLGLASFWQIRDLFVAPAHRRRGVARALIEAVREAATAAGATRLSLVTEADNEAALELYSRSGYTVVAGHCPLTLQLTGAAGHS
jgi:ribosomal protein S18 acetylase RimI-like enzyme